MVRKRDRVISTLVIWVALLAAISFSIDRMNHARLNIINHWYYPVGVVTGVNSEEALRVYDELQFIGMDIFSQVHQIARAEFFNYLPYILLIYALLLAGGVVSTLFIWRSVIVPAGVGESIILHNESERQKSGDVSIAGLLDDDGELIDSDYALQPEQNHRRK